MAKNEVAEIKKTAVATADAFDAFSGSDSYGHTAQSDFVIPRIAVLGDLSPQLKKNKAEYIEGSEVGDVVDIAMGKILAKGFAGEVFPFLPVVRVKEAITWKPRTAGGGIVKRVILHEDMSIYATKEGAVQNEKFEWKLKNGDEIIETVQFYGINLADQMPCFIPMKKSNMKIARKWLTKMMATKLPNGKTAPMFYRSWNIGSFLDSGNGNEWPNFIVNEGPLLQELEGWQDIFTAATTLLEIVKAGDFKADLENEEGGSSTSEDDIPF